MIKRKIKLYYKALIQLFFKFLYGEILVSKNFKNLVDQQKIDNPLFKTYANKSYNLYKVTNARIFTDNNENVAIIKDNFVLPKISFQQIQGRLKSVKQNSVIKKGTHSFVKKINGKVFNLSQGSSGKNYFHFMFDILPKIYLLKNNINLKEIDFFYLNDPKKWQIKILNKIGISKKKLLCSKINKHIIADVIYSVDHPWYFHGLVQYNLEKIPGWIINYNRKLFLNNNNKFFNYKIFLDRSNSSFNHCQIENLNEITNFIKRKKFTIYRPENLSLKKQIQLFKNSSIIIGAHGAAFTNIMFCKPGTKIIEIIPKDHPNKKCKRICKILKLKYFRVETKPDNSDVNFPFKININKNDFKLLEKIINP